MDKQKKANQIPLLAAFFMLPFLLAGDQSFPASSLITAPSFLASDDKTDVIVLFNEDASVTQQQELFSALPADALLWSEDQTALVSVPTSQAEEWLSYFTASKLVAAADYDGPIDLSSISEDAYSEAQWGLDNPGSYSYIADMNTSTILSVEDIDMNVAEAWAEYDALVDNPREVIVAVIDTGVDINHPDLAQNIWVNQGEIPGDGIDNDNNGYIDDINGWDFYHKDNTVCHYAEDGIHADPLDDDDHGTHVAGIIAAVKDNNIGIAGVASNVNVKIMVLKIHGGQFGNGTISNAIRAIHYATAMGADICNISWGTSKCNLALEQAIRESDMLFVTAAGNSGTNNNSSPTYPASFGLDNLISVTFLDASGRLSSKSNYGTTTVDLAAPGVHIYSTSVGGYASLSGSSMATPHVAGVAALLYSCGNNLYPSNIKEILLNTVKPIESLDGKMRYPGIPDALAALYSLSSIKKDFHVPTLTFRSSFSAEYLLLAVQANDAGGSGIRTVRYAIGSKELSYFRHGTAGTAVSTGTALSLVKAGTYTFYVSDYAGNERALIFQVLDDTTPPEAELSYKVAFDLESMVITVKASDTQSGVKTVQYAKGEQTEDYFLSGTQGETIAMTDGRGTVRVREAGIYTVYLTDYRGNKTVQTINVEIIPSTAMSLPAYKRTITVGKTYKIVPVLTPTDSTDKLRFRSSDTSICTVNAAGRVTGVTPGKAVITVRTASGIVRRCTITVKASS